MITARGLLGAAGAIVLTLVIACEGEDAPRVGPAEGVAVALDEGGGGGGAPPDDAQGDALPAGRRLVEVPEAFRDQATELWLSLQKRPHETGLLLRMGQLMQDAGHPREAAHYYERYLQLLPESQPVWLRLANTYGAASDWRRAADASLRMLERFPEDASAMYSLGAALANQGQYEDARGWWEKVLLADDPVLMGRALRALEQLSEY